VWPGDWVDESKSRTHFNLLCSTSADLGNFMLGVCSIYIGRGVLRYTGTRICTLVWHWIPFSTHVVLYLTTIQCLLQLATRPKASNGAGPTIIYRLTRWRERRLLHISALQPSPSNACQVKFIFESVKASVSNGSGPSLRVRVRVGTEPQPDWQSGSSINPHCRFGYGSIDFSLPVLIVLVLSGLYSGFICKFI